MSQVFFNSLFDNLLTFLKNVLMFLSLSNCCLMINEIIISSVLLFLSLKYIKKKNISDNKMAQSESENNNFQHATSKCVQQKSETFQSSKLCRVTTWDLPTTYVNCTSVVLTLWINACTFVEAYLKSSIYKCMYIHSQQVYFPSWWGVNTERGLGCLSLLSDWSRL